METAQHTVNCTPPVPFCQAVCAAAVVVPGLVALRPPPDLDGAQSQSDNEAAIDAFAARDEPITRVAEESKEDACSSVPAAAGGIRLVDELQPRAAATASPACKARYGGEHISASQPTPPRHTEGTPVRRGGALTKRQYSVVSEDKNKKENTPVLEPPQKRRKPSEEESGEERIAQRGSEGPS
jgi:hypothetical protein